MSRVLMIIILSLLVSCNVKKKEGVQERMSKRYFYKLITPKDSAYMYRVRDYTFIEDTIRVDIISTNGEGELVGKDRKSFIRKETELYMLFGKNHLKTELFLSEKIKDSCYFIDHPMVHSVKICYQGRTNYEGYKGTHKYFYSEQGMDGVSMDIYLDKDYTLIAKSNIVGHTDLKEEVRIDESVLTSRMKKSFEEVLHQ